MRLEDRLDQVIDIECGMGTATHLLEHEFTDLPSRVRVLLACDADIDWTDEDEDADIRELRYKVAVWYTVEPDNGARHGYRLVADLDDDYLL